MVKHVVYSVTVLAIVSFLKVWICSYCRYHDYLLRQNPNYVASNKFGLVLVIIVFAMYGVYYAKTEVSRAPVNTRINAIATYQPNLGGEVSSVKNGLVCMTMVASGF